MVKMTETEISDIIYKSEIYRRYILERVRTDSNEGHHL